MIYTLNFLACNYNNHLIVSNKITFIDWFKINNLKEYYIINDYSLDEVSKICTDFAEDKLSYIYYTSFDDWYLLYSRKEKLGKIIKNIINEKTF